MGSADKKKRQTLRRQKQTRRREQRHRVVGTRFEQLESRLVLDSALGAEYQLASAAWFEQIAAPQQQLIEIPTQSGVSGFVGPLPLPSAAHWIVRLTPEATQRAGSVSGVETLLTTTDFRVSVLGGLGLPGQVLVELPKPNDAVATRLFQSNPLIASFERDGSVAAQVLPNDSQFGQQLGLQNTGQQGGTADSDIDAPEAWDIRTDASSVVVSLVDSGIDYTHVDLYQNIWINQGEIPAAKRAALTDTDGDGRITFIDLNHADNAGAVTDRNSNGRIDAGDLLADASWADGNDTDGNSFRDDLFGYDFVSDDNNPLDEHRHGTHVGGTIGASGDNMTGVAGVAWNATIAPLRFLDSSNSGTTANAIRAINYATMMRVDHNENFQVINASWGSHSYSQELRNSIAAAGQAEILVVAAAGNGDVLGRSVNVDLRPFYPAGFDLDNIISVAASDQNDQLAPFSNFGPTTIDLAAPGVGIWSTEPLDTYQTRNGTSMATPHVTGAIALVWANTPEATLAEVRQAILGSVDRIPSLANKVATGGRLNVHSALLADPIPPRVDATAVSDISVSSASPHQFTVTYVDNKAIDVATIDDFDVLVTKLGDFSLSATAHLVSVDTATNGTPRTAIYEITAPGGAWDDTDNGQYQLALRAGQVRDTKGNPVANRTLATFRVNIPKPQPADIFVVADTTDSVDANPGDDLPVDSAGRRTLRAAVMESNAHAGPDTIQLAAGVYTFAIAAADDTSAAGDLDVLDTLTIIGAGQDETILDAADLDRIFHILPGVSLTLSKLTLRNGTADVGGGVLNEGNLSLSEVSIAFNIAADSGGGLATLLGATSAINLSTLTDNQSPTGGGLVNSGTLSLTDTTVSDNSATATDGGGLLNVASGSATISRSTFVGNAAFAAGGAISNAGPLTLTNATLSTNSADTGGALSTTGTSTLTNVTVANNSGTTAAGGVSSSTSNTSVRNTIIATNIAPTSPDVSGSFTSGGNSLIGASDGSTAFANGTNADQVGTAASPRSPSLAPLNNYGGPTATYSLLPASTAIDAGSDTNAPVTDQRGAPRQLDGPDANTTTTVDIGAFEFGTFFVNDTTDSVDANLGDGLAVDANGRRTLRAAIQEANATTERNVVFVAAGRYALTIPGRDEDNATTGDLDVRNPLTLVGAGREATIVDARQLDRVFHILTTDLDLADLHITGGHLDGSSDGDAGGGINSHGNLVLCRVNMTNNTSMSGGGAIYASGNDSLVRLEDVLILGNRGGTGAGILAFGPRIEILDSRIESNEGNGNGPGGGVYMWDGAVGGPPSLIQRSRIANNRSNAGGGLYFGNQQRGLIISDTTIEANTATLLWGGGIVAVGGTQALLQIQSSLLENNVSTTEGGGFYSNSGRVEFTNSTISGNRSTQSSGGGVAAKESSRVTLTSTTLTGNVGNGNGGLLLATTGSNLIVTIANSLIAKNSGDVLVLSGRIDSNGGNLIGDGVQGNFVQADSDIIGSVTAPIDPLISSLQDNGGPTWTHPLRPGSPAIDAGLAANAASTDARGVARPQDGDNDGTAITDIGAFELIFGEPTVVRGRKFDDQNANGVHDEGETGLKTRTVFVDLDYDGVHDPAEPSTVTNDNGDYSFTGLAPGDYMIGEVQQPNWQQTFPKQLDFQTATTLNTADRTQDVASGDLDGDGDADLVAANFGANNVSVLLGNGPVSFANAVNVVVGTGPVAVTLADLDGDGRLDIVTANATANSVSVLRNLGGGAFAVAISLTVGTSPQDVVAFDVDDDGDVDLVTANSGSNGLSVLRNNGNGTFAAAVSVTVPSSNATPPSPVALAVADLDGDGDDDLAVANLNSFDVAILANDGQGTFTAATNLTVGSFPRSIAAADVSGDGRADLVVANSLNDNVSVLLNSGGGLFADRVNYAVGDGPRSVVLRDISGDGNVDLVTANANSDDVTVLQDNGDGSFVATPSVPHYTVGDQPRSVVVDDFDRDGHPDLVTANFDSDNVTVLRNIQGFHRVTLLPSDRLSNLNFGNQLLRAELHGAVYRDLDNDGVRDEAEPPIAGWTLYLDQNHNGTLDVGEPSTATDASGQYAFTNLAPLISYTVRQVVQTGWEPTSTPDEYSVTPAIGSSVLPLDFGNRALPGEIRGRKFEDLNGNGIQESNERGLADLR